MDLANYITMTNELHMMVSGTMTNFMEKEKSITMTGSKFRMNSIIQIFKIIKYIGFNMMVNYLMMSNQDLENGSSLMVNTM
jgi:hypothetical protein